MKSNNLKLVDNKNFSKLVTKSAKTTQYGKVHLVGAGPGDPDLITVKALKLLQSADAIVYDRLANSELLEHAQTHCDLIYVGKRKTNTVSHRSKFVSY